MLVCVQVIFNITILIFLFVAARYIKIMVNEFWDSWVGYKKNCEQRFDVWFAESDRHYWLLESLKIDIDVKFGPDLIEKLNAVFKIGEHPKNLVVGKDGQFHKINREY